MILLTRLNGSEIGVNADLIERVEATPDTVICLIDGTRYVVRERPTEVVSRIVAFRARILALAERIEDPDEPADDGDLSVLRLVAPPSDAGAADDHEPSPLRRAQED
jgi:flagellar protein FlbD